MDVIRSLDGLERLGPLRERGAVTLVPTMGALHEGHLSLVGRAKDFGPVVVSIFVNPKQFAPGEDFESYPRDLDSDLALLEPFDVAAVFAPPVEAMYGAAGGVSVRAGSRSAPLCGAGRAGHFDGVVTVVAKLFNLLRPEVAIFGRKDAQQCLVIEQMVRDLNFPLRLVDAPTVREPDGLAMSSRNRYLDAEQRRRAVCLVESLNDAGALLESGERDPERILAAVRRRLETADALDYAELRTVPELETATRLEGRILLALAAKVGAARLIDNRAWRVDAARVSEIPLLSEGEA